MTSPSLSSAGKSWCRSEVMLFCPSCLCSSLAFSLVDGGWFRSHFVAGFILNVLLIFKCKLQLGVSGYAVGPGLPWAQ